MIPPERIIEFKNPTTLHAVFKRRKISFFIFRVNNMYNIVPAKPYGVGVIHSYYLPSSGGVRWVSCFRLAWRRIGARGARIFNKAQ